MTKSHEGVCATMSFVFAFLLLTILSACSKGSGPLEPPLILPLVRLEPINIDVSFRIDEAHLYALIVSFKCPEKDAVECSRVRKLAVGDDESGSAATTYGSPLSVQFLIEKREAQSITPVVRRSIDSERLKLSSWGWGSFNKELIDFRLEPGEYRLVAGVIRTDPALKDVEIDLKLVQPYRGK